MTPSAQFMQRLELQHPIIQAPMAGTSTPALAAAVSNAGGLGSLGVAACSAAQAQEMIQQTRVLTPRPFNVNVFCHESIARDPAREQQWLRHLTPLFEQFGASVPSELRSLYQSFLQDAPMLEMLLEQRPAVVSFHFGLPPAAQIRALQEAGCYTLATATNLREAALIEAAGVDAIVAQGIEAGGHRGVFDPALADSALSTAVLLGLLRRQTRLPLIAAGGIMDGRSINAMLELGAAAVQMGTAFVFCPESAASDNYRYNLKSERAAHTRLTSAISGRPARGMVNTLIETADAAGRPEVAAYPYAYDAAKQLSAAALQQGNQEFAAQWAGQGAPLGRELPAAELVKLLSEEMLARRQVA